MDTTTTGAPERRVLLGDAGAPLDTDRVLAIALRWADRPLTVEHVHVGQLATPLDCVEVKWEGSLPVFALADGTRAWVERENGKSEAGRRVGLELGEVLLVETGQLTLEARVQKRSEKLVATGGRRENVIFGLVVAHALMLFMAVTTAMVITPRTDDESIWGGSGFLRLLPAQFTQIPKHKPPELQQKIDDAIAKAPSFQQQQQQISPIKRTAKEMLHILLGGGGGGGFGGGPNNAIDAALDKLGPGNGDNGGMGGMNGRDLGGGIGPGNGPGMGVGPLVAAGLPTGGFPNGLNKKPFKVIACETCGSTPPGYDRDLVLKVVKRHQNQIRFCYESELNKNPDLAGKITVAWTIDGTGSVSVAQIAESGLKNDAVERCIVDRVRAWRFPEPAGGGEVAITFPWVFTTAGDD